MRKLIMAFVLLAGCRSASPDLDRALVEKVSDEALAGVWEQR